MKFQPAKAVPKGGVQQTTVADSTQVEQFLCWGDPTFGPVFQTMLQRYCFDKKIAGAHFRFSVQHVAVVKFTLFVLAQFWSLQFHVLPDFSCETYCSIFGVVPFLAFLRLPSLSDT